MLFQQFFFLTGEFSTPALLVAYLGISSGRDSHSLYGDILFMHTALTD